MSRSPVGVAGDRGVGEERASASTATPGKQTLTGALPAAVQRTEAQVAGTGGTAPPPGDGSGGSWSALSAAATGIETPTAPLPHRDALASSFGPEHDVAAIRAHVGGAGEASARAMGAQAYATGD